MPRAPQRGGESEIDWRLRTARSDELQEIVPTELIALRKRVARLEQLARLQVAALVLVTICLALIAYRIL